MTTQLASSAENLVLTGHAAAKSAVFVAGFAPNLSAWVKIPEFVTACVVKVWAALKNDDPTTTVWSLVMTINYDDEGAATPPKWLQQFAPGRWTYVYAEIVSYTASGGHTNDIEVYLLT